MRIIILLLLLVSPLVLATSDEQLSAESWLSRLSKSLKSLNFSTSFVVVKNNQAEPYHWFHGVNEQGVELEILSLLNGPRRDVLRKDNVISYIEPELPPYSVLSTELKGPIPNVLSGDVNEIAATYDFVSIGKSRVLGRGAQLVRIVPKDNHRFGHWLWLDSKTGMLLKLVIATKQGQLLEQIQFTHLEIADKPSESISQLESTELPRVLEIPEGYQQQALSWEVNWLPDGFKSVNTNRHRLSATKQAVEFILFSDGLVDISVYVNPSRESQRATDFVFDGATVALNQVVNGMEVSVVGKIPSGTAKRIADSVALGNGR
ncbi:MucB/RseB C-terminal domain-containing protein [Thalassotalea fusca]